MTMKPLRGLILPFLLLLLTACGGKTVATRVERVNVPAPQPVRAELVAQVPEPELPARPSNRDLAEYVLDLQQWGRGAYKKLAEIAGAHPAEE